MALASPFPDVEIPDLSVPAFVLAAGRDRPDAPALIDGLKGDVITHGQLAVYVDRLAATVDRAPVDATITLAGTTPCFTRPRTFTLGLTYGF